MGQLEQFLSDMVPNGDWQPLIDYINQNYVSKDKIKDIRKAVNDLRNKEIEKQGISLRGSAIDILDVLLEE